MAETLKEQIKRFVATSRGKGRLKPAAQREAIGIARSEALPSEDQTDQVSASFLGLPDTPNDYTDQGGMVAKVAPEADRLIFESAVASPLTEQSRITEVVRVCCDTNPDFFIDIEVAKEVTFTDANGVPLVMVLTPDTTSNCPE